jgi:hypothetical protein
MSAAASFADSHQARSELDFRSTLRKFDHLHRTLSSVKKDTFESYVSFALATIEGSARRESAPENQAFAFVRRVLAADNWWASEDFEDLGRLIFSKTGLDSDKSEYGIGGLAPDFSVLAKEFSRSHRLNLWFSVIGDLLRGVEFERSAEVLKDRLVSSFTRRIARVLQQPRKRVHFGTTKPGPRTARDQVLAFELLTGISPPSLVPWNWLMPGINQRHGGVADVADICRSLRGAAVSDGTRKGRSARRSEARSYRFRLAEQREVAGRHSGLEQLAPQESAGRQARSV